MWKNHYTLKIIIGALIIGFLLILINSINQFDQSNDPKEKRPPNSPEIVLNTEESFGINITDYPSKVHNKDHINLSWTYDEEITLYGNKIDICLVAYDSKNRIIDTIRKNDDICFYGQGGEHFTLHLAAPELAKETAKIGLPNNLPSLYEQEPAFYVIQVLFIDQRKAEGLSEWAGTVGYAETEPIKITLAE